MPNLIESVPIFDEAVREYNEHEKAFKRGALIAVGVTAVLLIRKRKWFGLAALLPFIPP